ncbi:putative Nitrosoguanidine resistance protein SNG1 [Pleurostoma richardsiae]|uniref:Nitrosoguanidine resistance protein SNG1 n=1 Tax=Pleurostoma richardsiae TaxID=41990 RepID=A0AA38VJK4_9PEZI|nr:putative Nitrosoguanidine resistance protein SNG1 [Pleurostoma richardsiae]
MAELESDARGLITRLYPKAKLEHVTTTDRKQFHANRIKFLQLAGKNFLLLQLLFLGLFSYVFGSLFQQSSHIHNINVAFVDYDGGAIGAAVRAAYQSLRGETYPTLLERSPESYNTPGDLRHATCMTDYWAALYVSPGASASLARALAGNGSAGYDKTDVLTFVWNEARYSATVDAVIATNLQTLSSAARMEYITSNSTSIGPLSDPVVLSLLAQPWELTSIDIQPTTQGSRAIYNTLVIILILIQEFFYLGTINGLYQQLKIYGRIAPARIILVRNLNSGAYCFVGSLCTVGTIWAFRSGWDVNANQFVLSWMIVWLFAHLNFVTLDVFTIWAPLPYVPMALISWVIFNVTSILLPFELCPGFYRIGYAAPAHEVYQVLIDIWSRGCNPQLYYALPIMFTWEVAGVCLSALGVYRRCHYTTLAEQDQEKKFKERLDAAMEFERKREREIREAEAAHPESEIEKLPTSGTEGPEDEAECRDELSKVMSRQDSLARRDQRRASEALSFGPCFSLPFAGSSDSDE